MVQNKKYKILIIRFSSIGDIVLTTPVIRCLYNQLNCEIHYLTKIQKGGAYLFEIDVQGALNLKQALSKEGCKTVSIFLMSNPQELQNRLRVRGTETQETIQLRLKNAEFEIENNKYFDYIVINDTIIDTVKKIKDILKKEGVLTMQPKYNKFLTSYAVSKRAKQITEEGLHYFEKENQEKNEILEAIKEIDNGIISISVNIEKSSEVKAEDDTLELLYETLKKNKVGGISRKVEYVKPTPIVDIEDLEAEEDLQDDEEVDEKDDELEEELILDDTEKNDIHEILEDEVEVEPPLEV